MQQNEQFSAQKLAEADLSQAGTLSVFELAKYNPTGWSDSLEKPPLLRYRQINREEAETVQAAMEQAGNYPPNDADSRLERSRLGYVGEVETAPGRYRMVTYGWVALDTEPMGNSGWAFQPPAGDAWLYDFATLPDYRGHGYYPTLLRFILGELAGMGVGRAWIGTAPGNAVSALSIKRAGFTRVYNLMVTLVDNKPQFHEFPDPAASEDLLELAKTTTVEAR